VLWTLDVISVLPSHKSALELGKGMRLEIEEGWWHISFQFGAVPDTDTGRSQISDVTILSQEAKESGGGGSYYYVSKTVKVEEESY
jgi:hypothetical protein